MPRLSPKRVGFYSAGNPARSVMASALLYTIIQEKHGGRIPLEPIPVVDKLGIDEDKIVGRVVETLSKHGIDVPPVQPRLVRDVAQLIDVWVVFTREDESRLRGLTKLGEGAGVVLLGGSPEASLRLPDTTGDFSTLLSSMKPLIEEVAALIFLVTRLKHIGDVVGHLRRIVEAYDVVSSELDRLALTTSLLGSKVAEEVNEISNDLIKLSGADGVLREYVEAYGNLCVCGGVMRLTSERLFEGVYELVFVCGKCGRRSVRHH